MAGKVISQADWHAVACEREEFMHMVANEGTRHRRELPWRFCDDPYGVLVSEVMLQQTQVARVMRYWQRWLALFPTADALAAADTASVLEAWQGLGYNRRALALRRACEVVSASGGEFPRTAEELEELPGIGPATAAGVVAFAFNRPAVYLETNVRSVFLHCLFPEEEGVADKALLPYVADTCPEKDPRSWYYELLDFGAYLKSQGVNPSRRSRHYVRQSAFEGSHREKRGFLLKHVLAAPEGIAVEEAFQALDAFEAQAGRGALDPQEMHALVVELVNEGFFREEGGLLIP